ncbi:adenylyltransferase/cytidyltransferase family protein [Streptomyces sp. NPDC092129]|uniref:adenylyltransferase/cytidyltransferase family protein n=1 Tax=Streptomyces sp. NPDC092129 TaxID=3366010 RepID=UPI00381BD715
MTSLVCVTGRFQPVHHQHLELFELALREGEHLIIAVTNPDAGARREEAASVHRHLPSANPFTYYQRVRMLQAACAARGLEPCTTIAPFDLTRPGHWSDYVPLDAVHWVRAYSDWERHKAQTLAEAGYQVRVLTGDPGHRLSSSDIRGRLAEHSDWQELVPEAIVPHLRLLLTSTAKEQCT